MIIGERIRERLEGLSQSQSALARAIGVSPQAVSKMVSGGTNESAKLFQIARFLHTTPEFLTGETDDPNLPSLGEDRLAFRDAQIERDTDLVELEEINLRLGLGGTYLENHVDVQKRRFSRAWLRHFTDAAPEHLFWSIGDGDSMEPTIRSGEVILIDRSQQAPRMGDGIWAIAYGEIGMVKRLRPLPDGSVEIHSDNPLIPPAKAVDGELHVIGRVVAVVRRL
ncbi:S24 family peptidase [Novosphingobium sp.]|uniref:XRE family transcriptional regulator n=1 Tax=Novosphingobium sp. TaxID=1874826 RepID=UPI001EBA9E77|nr:S24 family peptidase [Novosphingobium sp.]MBK6801672.1 helix-turn-helix transcriptional regulator [Novosphingobium sp.]MBK9009960.1 helix-turn-helix transcriptional regulator [Novosphingobium sp.]